MRSSTRVNDRWRCIIVAGPAGSGKTEVARVAAEELGYAFIDADSFHSRDAVEKMSKHQPITDHYRTGWVERLVGAMILYRLLGRNVVIACSCLKRVNRERFLKYVNESQIQGGQVFIAWLDVELEELTRRISGRKDHFFPASLLQSQLDATELPNDFELQRGVVKIPATKGSIREVASRVLIEIPSILPFAEFLSCVESPHPIIASPATNLQNSQLQRVNDDWSCLILAGPAGSGKTVIAKHVAGKFGMPAIDADDFHSQEAIDTMSSHTPLTDSYREGWVERLIGAMIALRLIGRNCIISCSALRQKNRQRFLRYVYESQIQGGHVAIAWLDVEKQILEKRLNHRRDHFFPADLLASQLDVMEVPDDAEAKNGVIRVVASKGDVEENAVKVWKALPTLPSLHPFAKWE